MPCLECNHKVDKIKIRTRSCWIWEQKPTGELPRFCGIANCDSENVSAKVRLAEFEMSSIFSSYLFPCVSFSLRVEVQIPNSGHIKHSNTFKALRTKHDK